MIFFLKQTCHSQTGDWQSSMQLWATLYPTIFICQRCHCYFATIVIIVICLMFHTYLFICFIYFVLCKWTPNRTLVAAEIFCRNFISPLFLYQINLNWIYLEMWCCAYSLFRSNMSSYPNSYIKYVIPSWVHGKVHKVRVLPAFRGGNSGNPEGVMSLAFQQQGDSLINPI